jgi:phytoene dehydrogenase-like protein
VSNINSLVKQKASKDSYDAIVIGSGPNGLAAAIVLAKAGLSVLLIEARSTIGGGCRSAELTLPGYVHDVCSSIHPLGYGSPFFRTLPLDDFGLRWINPDVSYAHPFDNKKAILVYRSIEKTAEQLKGDADAYYKLMQSLTVDWDTLSEILLHPLSWTSAKTLIKHPLALANFGSKCLMSANYLSKTIFKQPLAPGVFAGLAAHSGLPLTSLASASIGLVLNIAAHAVGWPLPEGGAQQLSDSLAKYFIHLNGEIVTDCNINLLNELPTSQLILCDLMPQQVARMAGELLPSAYKTQLENYKYGPGSFKMDWALNGPIPWNNLECLKAPTVHLGGTFEEIAQSELAVNNGSHSKKPYVLLAQHTLFDPTRAPANKHTAWAYCHLPNGSNIDMTEAIENQIERFAKGFKERIIARNTISPTGLEIYNANYIGGDINGGSLRLSQLLMRPVARLNPYTTPNEKIYICSAATPPGAGVHGMSGYYAALSALNFWRAKKSVAF